MLGGGRLFTYFSARPAGKNCHVHRSTGRGVSDAHVSETTDGTRRLGNYPLANKMKNYFNLESSRDTSVRTV
jgi:hypothetical protein